MKHVLIVDDEKPFLMSVRDGLAQYGDQFRLHLAFNGQEAIRVLQEQPIDLVVTDLKMPVMDGFQLLAHMSGAYPATPVIVMTAFGTPDIEAKIKRFKTFHYLEKPLDLEALAGAIGRALSNSTSSLIRGITLATFLQLIKMENKTCTLKIKSGSEAGQLFINRGELMDAETANARGEQAAYQIVCWPDPEIEMEVVCRCKEKVIQESIEHILLEAFRIEDERRNASGASQEAPAPVPADDWSDVQAQLTPDFGGGETGRAPTTPAPAEPKRAPKATLVEVLARSPEVKAFALFDDKGFLREQKPSDAGLGKLVPSICLMAAEQAGAQLGHHLSHIEMQDREGNPYLLCATPGGQLVARLEAVGKGGVLVDLLSRNNSEA